VLATDAPNLLFVIIVPMAGLIAAFAVGWVVWKVLAGTQRPQ
jgi:hypothetical protein